MVTSIITVGEHVTDALRCYTSDSLKRRGANETFFQGGVRTKDRFFHQGPTSRLVQTTYYYDIIKNIFGTNTFRRPPPPSPPPRRQKNFGQCTILGGQKNFFGTMHCQYSPNFMRIFHEYLYLNNKLRAFGLFYFLFSNFLPDFSTLQSVRIKRALDLVSWDRLYNNHQDRVFNYWGGVTPPTPPLICAPA